MLLNGFWNILAVPLMCWTRGALGAAGECNQRFCKGLPSVPKFGCIAPNHGKVCYATDLKNDPNYNSRKACGKFTKRPEKDYIAFLWARKDLRKVKAHLQQLIEGSSSPLINGLTLTFWNLGKWSPGMGYIAHLDNSGRVCVLKNAPTTQPPKGERCLITEVTLKLVSGSLHVGVAFNTSSCQRRSNVWSICQIQKRSNLNMCKGGKLIKPHDLSTSSMASTKGVLTQKASTTVDTMTSKQTRMHVKLMMKWKKVSYGNLSMSIEVPDAWKSLL